jgi:holo-[acyl-carrier protein] synthase
VRVGIDLVAAGRLARLRVENPGALRTVFTDQELSYCLGKLRRDEHLAVRFAAKEAVMKALGTGLRQRMRWTEVEVYHGSNGRPGIRLHGAVAEWARARGLKVMDLSLSHTAGLAVAQALVAYADEQDGI